MKLYKFRSFDTYSLTALKNNYIWFSKTKDFNDPFEGAFLLDEKIPPKLVEQALKQTTFKSKEDIGAERYLEMLKSMGLDENSVTNEQLFHALVKQSLDSVINVYSNMMMGCFSKCTAERDPIYENLMWSHYADGLRGYCLVFDLEQLGEDFNSIENHSVASIDVRYQDSPSSLSLEEFISTGVMFGVENFEYVDKAARVFSTKSPSWDYENEVRFMSHLKTNKHVYSADALLEIVIGSKMPQEQLSLLSAIANNVKPGISIKTASLEPGKYRLRIC